MRARKFVAAAILILTGTMILPVGANAETKYYGGTSGGGCYFKVSTYTQSVSGAGGGSGWIALTEITDLNNGCTTLKPNLKYTNADGSGTIWNASCPMYTAGILDCRRPFKVQHQGKGAAKQAERGTWQYGGWFG